MNLSPDSGELLNEQAEKLDACEDHLRRYHQLALAGTLIGSTMHEVNNRLEILTNYMYLAKITVENPEKVIEYVEAATEELRRVGEITSRSLAFVRADLDASNIDLVELANSALQLHHEKISNKRINVELRMADSVVASVKRGEVLQVLVNLLLNSIQALPHSGNLHLRVALHGEKAVITIADNGTGIPESFRPSLFKSFKSNKETGTGLGLWVVKKIVDSHGGTINYRSSTIPKRKGTIFRIVLPLKQSPQIEKASKEKKLHISRQ